MIREVQEEACVTVLSHEFAGCYRIAELDGDVETSVNFEWAYWARVRVDEWQPEHEVAERTLVPMACVLSRLHFDPATEPVVTAFLACAQSIEARHRPREGLDGQPQQGA